MTKVLFAGLKDKKSSHDDNEGKPAFQTFMIELHKQAKISKQNKQHLRLIISSIRVGVVAKTDDEVYVLSTIKVYCCFLSIFFTVLFFKEGRVVENIESDVATLEIVTIMQKW